MLRVALRVLLVCGLVSMVLAGDYFKRNSCMRKIERSLPDEDDQFDRKMAKLNDMLIKESRKLAKLRDRDLISNLMQLLSLSGLESGRCSEGMATTVARYDYVARGSDHPKLARFLKHYGELYREKCVHSELERLNKAVTNIS